MKTFEEQVYERRFIQEDEHVDYRLMFDTVGKAARMGDRKKVVELCLALRALLVMDVKRLLRRLKP